MKMSRLLFVIGLLFLFIGSVNAVDLRQCNDVTTSSSSGYCQHSGVVFYSSSDTSNQNTKFYSVGSRGIAHYDFEIVKLTKDQLPSFSNLAKDDDLKISEVTPISENELTLDSEGFIELTPQSTRKEENIPSVDPNQIEDSEKGKSDSKDSPEKEVEDENNGLQGEVPEAKPVVEIKKKTEENKPGTAENPFNNENECKKEIGCVFKEKIGEEEVRKVIARIDNQNGVERVITRGVDANGEILSGLTKRNLLSTIEFFNSLDEGESYTPQNEMEELAMKASNGETINYEGLDHELIEAIAIGSEKLRENALLELAKNHDDSVNWGEVCEGFQSQCITAVINGGYPNLIGDLIREGHFNEITREDLLVVVENLDVSAEEKQSLIDRYNQENCEGILSSIMCLLGNKVTQEELYLEVLDNEIADLQGQNLAGEDFNENLIELTFKRSGLACQDSDNDCNQIKNSCSEGFYSLDCKSKVNELCKGATDADTRLSCSNLKASLSKVNEKRLVSTNVVFNVLSIVNNPDFSALKASQLFGFEEKFGLIDPDSNSIFGREGFSNICLAKIDGFLDKTRTDSSGGVTKFEFSNTSIERELQVRFDLRAQRTEITPDDRVAITYSYFIRAPDGDGIDYLIALFYKESGQIKKVALTNLLNLKAGDTISDFDNVEVPLNNTDQIDPDSFRIKLRANLEGTTEEFFQTEAAVILVTSGDQYESDVPTLNIGNSQGNSVARDQESDEDFDEDDMLDLMDDNG